MSTPDTIRQLYRSSLVVTGTHYSMTTLAGRLLECLPEFHLLHEPTNAEPTLSYDALDPPHWYEYYDDSRYEDLRAPLESYMRAGSFPAALARRLLKVRSPRHALEIARYVERKLPFLRSTKPVIFKDPFLAFSARTMQQVDGLKVVLTVRHPCGFAESLARKAGTFDFADLAQPALLEALPDMAADILRFRDEPRPAIEQAAMLWAVVYGFAKRYLVPDARTFVLRQDDLVLETDATLDRLLGFIGVPRNPAIDTFAEENLRAEGSDFSGSGAYYKRDGKEALVKWRERVSDADRARVRAITGDIAASYGYGEDSW